MSTVSVPLTVPPSSPTLGQAGGREVHAAGLGLVPCIGHPGLSNRLDITSPPALSFSCLSCLMQDKEAYEQETFSQLHLYYFNCEVILYVLCYFGKF